MKSSFLVYTTVLCCGLTVLSGCTKNKLFGLPSALKPMPWIFKMEPQGLSAQMSQGWKDGCESGMASMSNSYYRSNYKFQMDPVLRKDPDYYKVWKDVYNFCRHYVYGRTREANQRFRLSNGLTSMHEKLGANVLLKQGLFNFWGPSGAAAVPLENFGFVAGQPWVGDGAHTQWDFSAPYYSVTTGLHDALNWDLRPTEGFVW